MTTRMTQSDTRIPNGSEEELLKALRTIIGQVNGVSPDAIPRATSLRDLPGLDSIRMLRTVTMIERHFGIELPDDKVFTIDTLSELAALVREIQEQTSEASSHAAST
jgi:acyl carrier protein